MKKRSLEDNPWRLATNALVATALMLVAAIALVFAARWFDQETSNEEKKAKAALQASHLSLTNTQSDRERLEKNLLLFSELKKNNFTANPDRLRLVEALQLAAQSVPYTAVEWEIKPDEKLKTLIDDKTSTPVAQLMRVPIKLTAFTVHEAEWLTFLSQLQSSAIGYLSADSCAYDKKDINVDKGTIPSLDVVCRLSLLYTSALEKSPKAP